MKPVGAGRFPRISIRTRILVMVLGLIAVVFLLVLGAFNLLVRDYIETNVRSQLSRALQGPGGMTPTAPGAGTWPGPDGSARPPRGPGGSGQTIVVTGDYALVQADPASPVRVPWPPEAAALAEQLKAQRVDLSSTEIRRIGAAGREYYLVAVPGQSYVDGVNAFLVHYVDMTALAALASRINAVLVMVMGVAAVLAGGMATFLSGRIAEPVRQLTRFAARIGEGDFRRSGKVYQDSELAELAASMDKAAAQLEAYEEQQRTLFQNVSHELRTPLQAIRSNAEGIEHRILDGEKASRVIISETRRLTEMVDDLLCLSRVENASSYRALEQCDLRELLSDCAERQRSLAEERGVELEFDFDERPVSMMCDEQHLSRAFSNLVSNAIRYARSRIVLSCHRRGDGDGAGVGVGVGSCAGVGVGVGSCAGAVVSVTDDGAGIAEEDLPHVFERFYKGRGGKHGIGLALAKAVTEQHGGRIEARNTGDGAAVTIWL